MEKYADFKGFEPVYGAMRKALVLDEDVRAAIGNRLRDEGFLVERYSKGADDWEVLLYAVERERPLLTRDQGDFLVLHNEVEHSGILVDKHMNRRDPAFVASTVSRMFKEIGDDIEDQVWFVSNYYGRY